MTESHGDVWRVPRRVTLEDVARHAEVSRALVSIVLREAPGASSLTRERVLAAARELGYRTDSRARALAGHRSRLIGVMFGVDVGVFHFDMLDGLYAAAEQRGLGLVLSPLTKSRNERQAADSLYGFRFDALIMLGPPTVRPLLAGQVPLAVVGWHVDDPAVDVIRTSDDHGMAQAVGHLVRLGHRRIGHIDGGDTLMGVSRREAYRNAMHAFGLGSEIRIVPGGQTQFDGHQAARLMVEQGNLPTALVAYNDDTAVAAMALLEHYGIAVPDQLSVVGWDDNEMAAKSPVGLTSVIQDPMEMARLAVERLLTRIEGRPIDSNEIIVEPDLEVRSSTRSLAPPDAMTQQVSDL